MVIVGGVARWEILLRHKAEGDKRIEELEAADELDEEEEEELNLLKVGRLTGFVALVYSNSASESLDSFPSFAFVSWSCQNQSLIEFSSLSLLPIAGPLQPHPHLRHRHSPPYHRALPIPPRLLSRLPTHARSWFARFCSEEARRRQDAVCKGELEGLARQSIVYNNDEGA